MRTLLVLLDKEFRQFFRNPVLPKMAVMFPLMVMLVIPWVTTQDVAPGGRGGGRPRAARRPRGGYCRRSALRITIRCTTWRTVTPRRSGRSKRAGIDVSSRFPNGFERSSPRGRPEGQHLGQRRQRTQGEPRVAVYGADRDADPRRTACGERTGGQGPTRSAVQNRYNPTLEYRFYMIPR